MANARLMKMSRCPKCGEFVNWNDPNIHYGGHFCQADKGNQGKVGYTGEYPNKPKEDDSSSHQKQYPWDY